MLTYLSRLLHTTWIITSRARIRHVLYKPEKHRLRNAMQQRNLGLIQYHALNTVSSE